jgi:thiamine biosynthesis protein ThiI
MNRVLILHYHEIWLKGGNRRYFLSRLVTAVKRELQGLPVKSLEHVWERLILSPQDEAAGPQMLERLGRVFGIAYIGMALEVGADLGELIRAARELMIEKSPRSFAVRAKIAASDFGWNSMQLEREMGREILNALQARSERVRVNLSEPEITCWVEVIPGRGFVYVDRISGAGGLPAATAGRVVTLLSGGFDSAVAAYKMMRRGAHSIFLHFHATPSPSRGSSVQVAEEIVRALTPWQFTSRLYLIPFDLAQRQIVAHAPESYRVLLYRRLMARMAREVARAEMALGLVTGDSVSQVASQTLHNLAAVDSGMDLPVYRPLAGDDKEEVLRWARRIGTYSISCQPFEDCCPRFLPRSPIIFAKAEDLIRAEARLDIEGLITQSLEAAGVVEFSYESGQVERREAVPRRLKRLLARRETTQRTIASHPLEGEVTGESRRAPVAADAKADCP